MKRRLEEELARDIQEHIDFETRENIERGMSPADARHAALRKFGNTARVQEETYAVWRWVKVEQFLRDFRYALRVLAKNPVFAAVAVLTLALGIGMNTAVFSVINAVLIRPLPYPNAQRLVWLSMYNQRFKGEVVSAADFFDWRRLAQSFDQMAAYGYQDMAFAFAGQADQAGVTAVTEDFMAITGAHPILGRWFQPRERNAVVLAHRYFERRFNGDPSIIGKSAVLNGDTVTIVGVLPPDFRFVLPIAFLGLDPKEIDLYVLSGITPENQARTRGIIVFAVGRLKPGVPIDRARAELETIEADIIRQTPQINFSGMQVRAVPLQEKLTAGARPALLILLAAVGLVLLIACVNVANLLLARSTARQKEFAIRAAMGAGRRRMIWQLVAEGLVLALAGGVAGVLLARWSIVLMVRFAPHAVPRLTETSIDGRVLAFTLLVALGTGVLFGLAPAFAFARYNLHDVLKEGGKTSSAGSAGLPVRRWLVAAELAVAVVLLVGAGLLIKSFWRMNEHPASFNPENILALKVSLAGPQYTALAPQLTYFDRVLSRLAATPGVQAAGLVYSPVRGFIDVENRTWPPDQRPAVIYYSTSAGFFQTMGIGLVAGRWMTDNESQSSVLVNQAFVDRVFGGENPLGQRIRLQRPQQPPTSTIVGVVSNLKYSKLDADPGPEVYFPYHQSPFIRRHDVVVRAAGDPRALATAVRKAITDIDPTQPVYGVATLEQNLADSIAPRRFNMFLLVVFASVALALAVIGIYGVMSYAVSQRTHEIGVRMALGASREDVVGSVVRQGMLVASLGILAGGLAALGLTRLMSSLLYDVKPNDPAIFAIICLVLGAAALLACSIPAFRASRVDPVVALRYE